MMRVEQVKVPLVCSIGFTIGLGSVIPGLIGEKFGRGKAARRSVSGLRRASELNWLHERSTESAGRRRVPRGLPLPFVTTASSLHGKPRSHSGPASPL